MDKRLWWLALGGFAGANEGFLMASLLPAISKDMSVTIGTAGYLALGYALAYAIGTPILSTVFGRLDRRTLVIGAELGVAALAVAMALAPNFLTALVARTLLGMAAGLYTVSAMATATAMAPAGRRGRALAIITTGQSLALLVGLPISAVVMAMDHGWRIVYAVIAALAFAAAVSFLLLPKGIKGEQRSVSDDLVVLRTPGLPVALVVTLLFMVAPYLLLIYMAPIATYAGGLGRNLLPWVLLANGIGSVIGSLLGGRLADRLTARVAVIYAAVAMIVVLLGIVASPLLPAGVSSGSFLFWTVAAGVVGWAFATAQSSHVAGMALGAVPLALSLNMTALNVGVALAAWVGGAGVDRLGAWSLAAAGVAFAIVAALLAAVPRRTA